MAPGTPAEVFPPGDFLREELEARGWTQLDLADILGVSYNTVNQIATGKRGITPDTAMALAAAFGTTAEFWMRLEHAHQLWRNRQSDTRPVARRARLYEHAPVKDMIRRGWIPASESVDVLEASVLRFYGTQSLEEEPELAYAARKSTSYSTPLTPAQKAWMVRARQLAQALQVAPFSPQAAEVAVEKLRLLTHEAREARHIPRILAEAGIRFVVVEPIAGMKVDGACIWLGPDDPVVALALRYDRIDNFWFTLLHEIRHVIKRDTSLDIEPRQLPLRRGQHTK